MNKANDKDAKTQKSAVVPIQDDGDAGKLMDDVPTHNLQFPWKVHRMLSDTSKEDSKFKSVVSWLPSGVRWSQKSFRVFDKAKFETLVMPKYFASNKFKSFQRSLNLWGFSTRTREPDRGAISHEHFVRNHPELCYNMVRASKSKPSEHEASSTGARLAASCSSTPAFQRSDLSQWMASSGVATSNLASFPSKKVSTRGSILLPPPMNNSQRLLQQLSNSGATSMYDLIQQEAIHNILHSAPPPAPRPSLQEQAAAILLARQQARSNNYAKAFALADLLQPELSLATLRSDGMGNSLPVSNGILGRALQERQSLLSRQYQQQQTQQYPSNQNMTLATEILRKLEEAANRDRQNPPT